jgi:hypothetical protein
MGDYHVPFCENLRLRCLGLLDNQKKAAIKVLQLFLNVTFS